MPHAPVSFRDRPVLEHIVEQHAEEAAFLWTLRDAATDAPHYKRHHLARLDERVEAHVDGLRVAGEAGWRIALEQLERRCEKGELFAAGVLALESGDMRRIEPLVARAQAEPEARRGFIGAIAWCRPGALAAAVRRWAGSAEAFGRYLALCACSVHRVDAGQSHGDRLEDADSLVRARALRLAGELGRAELLRACLDHLDDEDGGARLWAAWSSVLLGDRAAAMDALGGMATTGPFGGSAALECAVRAMGIENGTRFVRALNGQAGSRRVVAAALGHLGDPAAMPWLIDRMDDTELACAAGESFAMITGVDLAFDGLERRSAAEQADEPGEDSPFSGAEDDNLPVPDPHLTRVWWERAGHRFDRGVRYLLGRTTGQRACELAWEMGYQRQRRAAAYELTVLAPGTVLRAWATKQRSGVSAGMAPP